LADLEKQKHPRLTGQQIWNSILARNLNKSEVFLTVSPGKIPDEWPGPKRKPGINSPKNFQTGEADLTPTPVGMDYEIFTPV